MFPKLRKRNNLLAQSLTVFLLMFFISFISVPAFAGVNDDTTTTGIPVLQPESVDTITQNTPPVDVPGNSSKIQIQAGNLTQIRLQDQLQLNLSVQEQAELTINISDSNPGGELPAYTHQFKNFYQFELNTSTMMQATFQMTFNKSDLPADATPQMLIWAYFNTNTNQWEYVYSWLNENNDTIMTQTSHFSTWTVLINYQDNKSIDPKKDSMNEINANGSSFKLENGNTYRFRTQSGFELNVSLGTTAELKINESNMYQYQYQYLNSSQKSIGKMLQLDLNQSGVTIQATLAYKIASSDVPADVDPFKLQFAYLDEANNQWKIQNSWVEDIGSGYYMVYAETDHFSTWSIVGSVATATDSSSSVTSSVPGFELLAFLSVLLIPVIRKKW